MRQFTARHILRLCILLAGLSSQNVAIADTVVAKKAGVKVLETPNAKGKTLQKLKKGEELSSSAREGVYWKVQLDGGKTGYVSILQVTRKAGGTSKLSEAIRKAAQDERSSEANTARARSGVMGVRGLSTGDETTFAANARPDFESVFAMEDRFYADADIERFEEQVFRELANKAEGGGGGDENEEAKPKDEADFPAEAADQDAE